MFGFGLWKHFPKPFNENWERVQVLRINRLTDCSDNHVARNLSSKVLCANFINEGKPIQYVSKLPM